MVALSEETSTPTAEQARRVKGLIPAVLSLTILGLVPRLLVRDKGEYLAAWSAFLVVSFTSMLSGLV